MKNLKLGMRLGLGFGLMILLMAILVFFGVTRINTLDQGIDRVVNDRMPKTVLANAWVDEVNAVARVLRNVVILTDVAAIEKEDARIQESRDKMDVIIDSLESGIKSEEGIKVLKNATQYLADIRQAQEQLRAFAKVNNDSAAATLLFGDYRKLQSDYLAAITTLIEFQTKLAQDDGKAAAELASATQQMLIILALIALAIGVLAAFLITKSITKPVSQCIEIAEKVASGDTSVSINVNSQDEIGMLLMSLKNMVGSIQRMSADAKMLAKAAVEGKLATRADASKHEGDFRGIVQGVNDTLDAVINPLNVTAKYVDDISKGIIPPTITDNYNGDFNLIKGNLNAVVKMMNDLLKETDVIIKAAADGELDKRANAALFLGGWNQLVTGINDTITNIVDPLMVTADYVDKCSKGVIPPEITTVYKGQYNSIKTNLNAMVKMMNDLLKETNVIIKAAADGELDKRANAALFLGGWNQLVTGINDTITNIVDPLMVTADYVDKCSKGVIPPEITTVYKGQYNSIKTNLNAMVKMMNDLLKETNVIIKAAADGELDKRANAALFLGGWNQLVTGINDTITNIVDPLMVTADYVDKCSKGVIPPEITTVYKGQYNSIKINLNSMVKMMNDLLRETDTLVNAALTGSLNTRANVTLFLGGWNQLVSGINKTLDAVLEPINEAAGILDKVAARDMTARVKGDYKGDHAKIKNSLNLAVENLDRALGQVGDATGQVASASQQISAGSQSLAQGANEQASSLEEVSSSLEEMSSMTKQNADNAIQAKNLAGEANTSASEGTEAMNRMSSAINRIKESSDQTAKIIKTIDEIAMQTNLLALNAAVEAARAGEAGRGFAVVAEEVRNLAQRSAQAAKNTADMIGESVKFADDGVKISNEVSKSFVSIAGGVKKVNDLITEIAAASKEQAQGLEQVNTAVSQMDKVTQQNAANSEESASAAEELSSQAEELQAMVSQFQLSHSGNTAQQRRPAIAHHAGGTALPPPRGKSASQATNRKVSAEEVIPLDDSGLKEF